MRSYAARVPSPLGPLTLLFDGDALTGLGLLRWRYPPACLAEAAPGDSLPVLAQTRRWLDAYFARQTLPPEPPVRTAGTPFQELVWAELRRIPRGTVTTYGAIAGAAHEVDLDVLATPPADRKARTIAPADLTPVAPTAHAFTRVEMR